MPLAIITANARRRRGRQRKERAECYPLDFFGRIFWGLYVIFGIDRNP